MDAAKARKHMVDSQVRPNDVTDVRLQSAMATLPRERFVPANRKTLAYVERDVSLFEGRALLKAREFSKLVHAATIQPDDLVLDVGCGYGYSTAVLSHLAGVVVGLEESEEIAAKATERLSDLGLDNVVMMTGPLEAGWAKQAPFDVIVVAAGIESGIETLLSQLKDQGGRLVAIKVTAGVGTGTLYTRSGSAFGERKLFECHAAGILPGFAKPDAFQF
ncbi:MAG: protein-L-isoaspartate O-methyltransferase [Pseudomonadota bacterium]